MKSNYASVNGIKMYFEVYGSSNEVPLVLIHGGGSTIPSNWGNMLPLLHNEYKVIALEMQAHGRTSDRDVITTEHTVLMSRLIPDARLAILPGNHGSFIGEVMAMEKGSKMPEIAAGVVNEFLGRE